MINEDEGVDYRWEVTKRGVQKFKTAKKVHKSERVLGVVGYILPVVHW